MLKTKIYDINSKKKSAITQNPLNQEGHQINFTVIYLT